MTEARRHKESNNVLDSLDRENKLYTCIIHIGHTAGADFPDLTDILKKNGKPELKPDTIRNAVQYYGRSKTSAAKQDGYWVVCAENFKAAPDHIKAYAFTVVDTYLRTKLPRLYWKISPETRGVASKLLVEKKNYSEIAKAISAIIGGEGVPESSIRSVAATAGNHTELIKRLRKRTPYDELRESIQGISVTEQKRSELNTLLRENYAALVTECKRLKPQNIDPRELANETCRKILTSFDAGTFGYDPSTRLMPYLITTARNIAVDFYRRGKTELVHRPTEANDEDPNFLNDIVDTQALDPVEKIARDTLKKEITRVIKKLPKEQAEALKLWYLEDMSHHSIAKELNISVGTVKSRIRLAMEKIRDILKEDPRNN